MRRLAQARWLFGLSALMTVLACASRPRSLPEGGAPDEGGRASSSGQEAGSRASAEPAAAASAEAALDSAAASAEAEAGILRSRRLAALPSLPDPRRELRALWVATVYNLDWPSKPALPASELAAEADAILDRAGELGFNAVFLQARAAGDALYGSDIVSWSRFISGKAGEAPDQGFDPLAYWLEGAQRRGLLLLAWMNPFRVGLPGSNQEAPPGFPAEAAYRIGKGYTWLDPGHPQARDHVVSVFKDLARRYPVDGIVMDDYLYPYASLRDGQDFPDGDLYATYKAGGGALGRTEWRVENGKIFMRALSRGLEAERPGLILGVSPFGIYRSGIPEGIRGLSGRDETGLDALAWSREGLVDFVSPQLYWPSVALEQSFPLLLAWWKASLGPGPGPLEGGQRGPAALWPSLSPLSQKLEPAVKNHEALSEIMISRAMLAERPGFALYSARVLGRERASAALAPKPGEGGGLAFAEAPPAREPDLGSTLAPALREKSLPPLLSHPGLGPPPPLEIALGLKAALSGQHLTVLGDGREADALASAALGDRGAAEGVFPGSDSQKGKAAGPRFLIVQRLTQKGRVQEWNTEILPYAEPPFVPSASQIYALRAADARGRLSEPIFLMPPGGEPGP